MQLPLRFAPISSIRSSQSILSRHSIHTLASMRMTRNYSLNAIQVQEIKNQLNEKEVSGWEYVKDVKGASPRDTIHKEFQFKNFDVAWDFMSQVAQVAKRMDHHPEWFNVYNRVDVVLSTHDVQGVSEKDFKLASEMNAIADRL